VEYKIGVLDFFIDFNVDANNGSECLNNWKFDNRMILICGVFFVNEYSDGSSKA